MIPTKTDGPVWVHVTYRPKQGHEDALLRMVKSHWSVMRKLGLATETPAQVWRTVDRKGAVAIVELFQWRDAKASEVAHQTPEVMAVWEPMGNLMTGMDIAQAEQVV